MTFEQPRNRKNTLKVEKKNKTKLNGGRKWTNYNQLNEMSIAKKIYFHFDNFCDKAMSNFNFSFRLSILADILIHKFE